MARSSKFERQLSPGLRKIGFSIKIPDAGIGYKPFDYVVGIPTQVNGITIMRFVAIEAKTATGWVLNKTHAWQSHQRTALSFISEISPMSAWVAIGFLDLPQMHRSSFGTKLDRKYSKEAYLITWRDFLSVEGEISLSHHDLVEAFPHSQLTWHRDGSRYFWSIPKTHSLFSLK